MTLPRDLTPLLFRALYPRHDLSTVHGTYIVTPKGTPVLVSDSLGWIARQIAGGQPPPPESMDTSHGALPRRPRS